MDKSEITTIIVSNLLVFLVFVAVIVGFVIFIRKVLPKLIVNNKEMQDKITEITAKNQEAEENERKKQQLVTCPFCGRQTPYGNGQCSSCGGGLKLNE